MKKLVISVLMVVLTLSATNGMNVIGFGARASSLGGATQIVTNPHSLISNPAIMGFASKSALGLDLGLMFPSVHFTNNGSDGKVLNDVEGESQIFPLPTFSYLQKIKHSNFTFGFSALAQGGMGATYDLKHELYKDQSGNLIPQKYHSKIAYMKFSPAVSYNVNDNFSIGIAPSIGYAMLEMKMPYSMNPLEMKGIAQPGMTFGQMFAGDPAQGGLGYTEVTATADMEDGVTALGFGGTIGLDYKVNDQFSMGLSYTMQSDLTFEGDAQMDMFAQFGDAFGRMVQGTMQANPDSSMQWAQGKVMGDFINMGFTNLTNPDGSMNPNAVKASYDAEVEMSWPQALNFSISYSPAKTTTVYADIKWVNWKNAMKDFKMTMKNGDNSNVNKMMGSDEVVLVMPLNWEDQVVFGLGIEHKFNKMFTGRIGYNYGSNPVPAKTLIPLFPAIVEHHITAGTGIKFNKNFGLDLGYEFVLENEIEVKDGIIAKEYEGSKSKLGEHLAHIGFTYEF